MLGAKETEGQTESPCACRKASAAEGSLTCLKNQKIAAFLASTIKTQEFFVLLKEQMSHSDKTETFTASVPVISRRGCFTRVIVSSWIQKT